MALETATYIDELQATWPANTDAISAGDDHIRLIKKVLQSSFPYVSGPVGVSDEVLTRGAIPINAVTVFYMAAAPTGWTRVSVSSARCLRVVTTAAPGGISGGTDDPIVNAKVSAHYHAISFTSEIQNADHAHELSGETGNESSHTHLVNFNSSAVGNHQHYFSATTDGTPVVSNVGYVGTPGGASAALTSPNVNHVHSVSGWTSAENAHSHIVSGTTKSGSTHKHDLSGNTGKQNADHAHKIKGNSATPTVTESGGTLGAWRPRYADVILCRRTS